jgi:aminoglycoside phosphotransferase (APT) family kinase protein
MSDIKEPRRIVHIATATEPETYCPIIVAICNDGTLWGLTTKRQGTSRWEQLPEIPQ